MHTNFDNHWVEYRDPIHLMNRPPNMEIGFWWYKKETNNKWAYDHTNHLMKSLNVIASMSASMVSGPK